MSHPKHRSGWPIWLIRILLTVLLCGILIVAVGLLTLSLFSDKDWIKRNLLVMVENAAGGPVHIEHLEVNFLPSPQIILKGLAFTSEPPRPRMSLRINRAEVAFEWNSLWQRKLILTHGVLQEPELTLYLPLAKEPKEPQEWKFPSIQQLNIHNGHLHLMKPSDTDTPSSITWDHIQLTVSGMHPEGPTSILLAAQPPGPKDTSSINLQGLLTFIEQTPSSPEEPVKKGIPPLALQGQVKITDLPLYPLMTFLSAKLDHPPQLTMNFQSKYELTLAPGMDNLAFPDFQLSLNDWDISGQGRIVDLQTDTPLFGLSGSTESIAIERLAGFLPPAWLPPKVQNFLVDRKVKGEIQLLSGSVQGSWNQPDSLVAKGTVQLERGRFLTAPGHPPITQLSGTVSWDSRLISIEHIHGMVEPFTVTAPKALLHLREAGIETSIPSFQISEGNWTVTGEADFTHTKNTSSILGISASAPPVSIQHLARTLPNAWMPAQVQTVLEDRQVEGTVELVTGSLKWPFGGDEPPAVEGVIHLTQGQVLIDSHHPPLRQVSGSVAFNSNLLRMFDVQGLMYSSSMFIKEATLEWNNATLWGEIQGRGDILAQDIFQALLQDPRSSNFSEWIAGYQNFLGSFQVATHLKGPLFNPEQIRILEGKFVVNNVNMYPKHAGLPVTGVTGNLTFDHSQVSVKKLNGQIGNSPVQLMGQWNFRNATRSSNLLVHSNLAAPDFLTLFPALSETFSTFAGTLKTTIALSGTNSSASYRLHMDITDWALTAAGVIRKPENTPGTFDATGSFRDDAFIMKQGQLSLPPYQLDVKGSLAMRDSPAIQLGLRTESGTGSLLPKGIILGDERLGLTTLALALTLQGQDWDWTSWNVQGSVESTDRLRKTGISGSKPGSKRLRLTWSQKNESAYADLTLRNLLIETLMPFDPTPRFTGTLTLSTSMEMNLARSEWEDRLLAGKGDILLVDGRILTSPVLSKILGLLNVPNVLMGKINLLESGFPVDRLTSTFSVDNGLFSTKNLAMKSPVMALAAAGTYDLPQDHIQARITVSPFGAYSSLIKDIPLFGTLFEGERRGLTTALFKVDGPRTNPQVTYLPLQSLTGGILGLAGFPLDVLKNVLSLPMQEGKINFKKNGAP